jgi:hypothetical protein
MQRLARATDEDAFEDAIINWQERSPGTGDNTLANYLAKDSIQRQLLPILAGVVSKVLGHDVSFTPLIEAVNNRLVPGQKSNPVYNQRTILAFHMLFLACLVSMASAHRQLENLLKKYGEVGKLVELSEAPVAPATNILESSTQDPITPQELQFHIVALFQLLLQYTRLYVYLVSSASFKSHIEILQGFLSKDALVPNRRLRSTYERWANTNIF